VPSWEEPPVTGHSEGPSTGEDSVEEFEPDYRFTLANERTFLAWLRTSLALLAAAVAVVQFLPEFAIPGTRLFVGGVLASLAVTTAVAGLRRWEQVDYAIRRGLPLPRHSIPRWLAGGLTLIALLAVALVISMAVLR
jgi:putative membrane protein